MRRLAVTCAILAALALVTFLGLGFYGQHSIQQTKANLAEETSIAQELMSLKQAAESAHLTDLAQLAQQEVEKLPTSAQKLASAPSTSADIKSSLETTTDALWNKALSTTQPELRSFLFESARQNWDQGITDAIVTEQYSPAMLEKITQLETCTPAAKASTAPDTITNLMKNLNELTYLSSFYNARSDVDGYSQDDAKTVADINTQAGAIRNQAQDVFSCAYSLPTRQGTYPLPSQTPVSSLQALQKKAKEQIDQALSDSTITDETALTELLVLQEKLK